MSGEAVCGHALYVELSTTKAGVGKAAIHLLSSFILRGRSAKLAAVKRGSFGISSLHVLQWF